MSNESNQKFRVLRNLTLHLQGEKERALAARHGFDLRPEPEGVAVGPGREGLLVAGCELVEKLRACRERGEAVLVGGHTGVWLHAVARLHTLREALPPLFYFDTRRVRDEAGRFVFEPDGLVEIPIGPDARCSEV